MLAWYTGLLHEFGNGAPVTSLRDCEQFIEIENAWSCHMGLLYESSR